MLVEGICKAITSEETYAPSYVLLDRRHGKVTWWAYNVVAEQHAVAVASRELPEQTYPDDRRTQVHHHDDGSGVLEARREVAAGQDEEDLECALRDAQGCG